MVRQIAVWDPELAIERGIEDSRDTLTAVFRTSSAPRRGAILVAIRQGNELNPTGFITGLSLAHSISGIAQQRVRVGMRPWLGLSRPLPLDDLMWPMTMDLQDVLVIPRPLVCTHLSIPAGALLISLVKERSPEALEWLSGLPAEVAPVGDSAQTEAEARDGIGIAGEAAGIEIPAAALVIGGSPSNSLITSVVASTHLFDLEEDLIPDELRRFDGKMKHEQISSSVAIFRSFETELMVFNVNKKPFEVQFGVDLVYFDSIRQTATLLQYKRMELTGANSKAPKKWVYTRESEIRAQLDLMTLPPLDDSHGSADWRLTRSPFWFKFVPGDAGAKQDGRLLRGMYVPSEYLDAALNDRSLRTGSRGGFRVDFDNTKYVTRGTFVQLLRRGLIGTQSGQAADIHQVLQNLSASGAPAIVAMKTKWKGTARAELKVPVANTPRRQ